MVYHYAFVMLLGVPLGRSPSLSSWALGVMTGILSLTTYSPLVSVALILALTKLDKAKALITGPPEVDRLRHTTLVTLALSIGVVPGSTRPIPASRWSRTTAGCGLLFPWASTAFPCCSCC